MRQTNMQLEEVMKASFLETEQALIEQPDRRSGATAAVVLVVPGTEGEDSGNNVGRRLVAANVGDAGIVLSEGGKGVALHVEHSTSSETFPHRLPGRRPYSSRIGALWVIEVDLLSREKRRPSVHHP